MQLTSTKNPLLQTVRRAAASGRPTDDGLIVAEGPHLLEEALRGKWQIEQVFVTPEARDRYDHILDNTLLQKSGCEIIEVSARAFASMASTETSQELLALLRPREWVWDDLACPAALIAVLDGVQDPGNAGSMVRSAEAFGATGVVFLTGCARVANGKLLRATAGSLFRMPFLEGLATSQLIASLRASKLKLYALATSGAMPLPEADLRTPCALAIGREGAGLSDEIVSEAQTVRIPTANVESLNAAIAGAIALFSAQQQRGTA